MKTSEQMVFYTPGSWDLPFSFLKPKFKGKLFIRKESSPVRLALLPMPGYKSAPRLRQKLPSKRRTVMIHRNKQ